MSPYSPKVMTACALITEGMTEPWNWEMGWEDVASLSPGSDMVTTGGKRREERSCCTATRQTQPRGSRRRRHAKGLTMLCAGRSSQDGLHQQEGSLVHSGWTKLGYVS